jgi:hypothetical protein
MKTTAEKLRIAPGSTLWSSHDDRVEVLGPLPEGVELVDRPGDAATAVVFADDARSAREIGQVGLDDVWSALRFRPLAPGEVFTGGGKA